MMLALTRGALERPTVLVPIALALLAAAGATLWSGIADHEQTRALAPRALPPVETSLVADTDIARGQVLRAADFRLKAGAAPGALRQAQDADGHMALTAIKTGAPILGKQLSATVLAGIAARIPDGLRAFAVPVSEAEIAGGLLQAGDHVDLYATLPGALFADKQNIKPDDQSKSTLLLQSVAVLAVGTKLDGDGSANPQVRTVTLALRAEDLAKVALAARLGTISFGIRNPADDTAQTASQAGLHTLLGAAVETPPREIRKTAAPRGIPMLSGAARTTVTVP